VTTFRCKAISDSCKTWDLSNGNCLTCYDGYGSAMVNGSSVNGLCTPYNANVQPSTQNCQVYDVNRVCI
jgi:hypothetical protein